MSIIPIFVRKFQFELRVTAAFFAVLWGSVALGQEPYPSRPISIIVPYSAGGLTDRVARIVANEMKVMHGIDVIVENKTGGNTIIAASHIAKSKPDGYTVGWFASATTSVLPNVVPNLPFSADEFVPVALAFEGGYAFAVANSVPANNLAEYAQHIKKQNKPALIGVTALNGGSHLMSIALGHDASIPIEAVTYRGAQAMAQEMVADRLPAIMDVLDTFIEHDKAKRLKLIGISGESRNPLVPNTPTFAESGFKDLNEGKFYHGLFLPPKTPPEIASFLNEKFYSALASERVQSQITGDLVQKRLSPQQFSDYLVMDRKFWKALVERVGYKPIN